jgi:hypothetical protein
VPVIALVSGKAAPGVTTAVCVLASVWPRPVLVADCDPAGGDVLAGWLSPWLTEGWLRADIGLLSFATSTRHAPAGTAQALRGHCQHVYAAPRVWLLAGVRDAAQGASVGEPGWTRLADALAEISVEMDVLVDCGRLGPASPWPVLAGAGTVLVAAQPTFRGVAGARAAIGGLDRRVDPAALGLLVCATNSAGRPAREAARALELPLLVQLPHDPAAASVFSDGAGPSRGLDRSPLVRAARTAADRLLARSPDPAGPDGWRAAPPAGGAPAGTTPAAGVLPTHPAQLPGTQPGGTSGMPTAGTRR